MTTLDMDEASNKDAERGNGKAIEAEQEEGASKSGNGGIENISYVVSEEEGKNK